MIKFHLIMFNIMCEFQFLISWRRTKIEIHKKDIIFRRKLIKNGQAKKQLTLLIKAFEDEDVELLSWLLLLFKYSWLLLLLFTVLSFELLVKFSLFVCFLFTLGFVCFLVGVLSFDLLPFLLLFDNCCSLVLFSFRCGLDADFFKIIIF